MLAALISGLILVTATGAFAAEPQARVMESVVASLAYGKTCWSTIELRNLGERTVTAEVEPHKESGALVALAAHRQTTFELNPGDRVDFRLDLVDETTAAWIKIREKVPSPELSPVVAIRGVLECVSGDQLRTTNRDVAYPLRAPWFSGEVSEMKGNLVSLINTSERAVKASLCYSTGSLFSNPTDGAPSPDLKPICSLAVEVQIPPFGARQFPVERNGNSQFSIKVDGDAVVLQMLRPYDTATNMYSVDSTVQFLGETAGEKRQ